DLHSKFTINGVRYTLVNDIATLAAGIAANPSGAFALAKDYDAAADGIYQKPPIATKFTGSFEGLSHLIDHLTINGQMKFGVARSGLFAWIYRNGDIAGSVRDLNLRHAKVSSKARKVEIGILAGENDGSIAHVLVSGRVTALGEHAEAGGMVGSNGYQAIIQSSSAVGIDVSADNYHGRAGGIAGLNWSQADIYRSVATGTASGHLVGGLVGENSGVGAISQSYADVAIPSVDNGLAGGLVALNNFAITDCYSLGAVSGHVAAGFDAKNTKFGYIRTSYSTGLVTGSQAPGGFASDEEASDNALAADYWNLDTSGIADPSRGCGNIPNCPGVTGLTDAQLKSGLPDGFDPNIWGQSPNINNGYPYLLANPPQ
ncbi:MAG: hypothetical protein ACJ8EL_15310, partial [Rhizomicrobium sp.]